jgi:hypothetical protein
MSNLVMALLGRYWTCFETLLRLPKAIGFPEGLKLFLGSFRRTASGVFAKAQCVERTGICTA